MCAFVAAVVVFAFVFVCDVVDCVVDVLAFDVDVDDDLGCEDSFFILQSYLLTGS